MYFWLISLYLNNSGRKLLACVQCTIEHCFAYVRNALSSMYLDFIIIKFCCTCMGFFATELELVYWRYHLHARMLLYLLLIWTVWWHALRSCYAWALLTTTEATNNFIALHKILFNWHVRVWVCEREILKTSANQPFYCLHYATLLIYFCQPLCNTYTHTQFL